MFASCLGSITGVDNRLGFRRAERVVAVLVDGLGTFNIRFGAGHAPLLSRKLAESPSIHAGFPSTTATSITSFGTGLPAGQHGIVGYKVLDPETGNPLNQLTGWSKTFDPLVWQPNQTIAERAVEAGVDAYVIGPAEYANSGFTSLTMRGAKYLPAKSLFDRVEAALSIMTASSASLTYLYVPELDQKAHTFGVDSPQWLTALEDLDGAIALLTKSLSQRGFEKVGVVLTADHGVVDVPAANQFYLDQLDIPSLKFVAGDPRANYVYLSDCLDAADTEALVQALQEQLDGSAIGRGIKMVSRADVIAAKWFGPVVTQAAESRMPDLFAIAIGRTAIYHRDFAPTKSLSMIGQHGSISPEELAIPLLKFGAFAR